MTNPILQHRPNADIESDCRRSEYTNNDTVSAHTPINVEGKGDVRSKLMRMVTEGVSALKMDDDPSGAWKGVKVHGAATAEDVRQGATDTGSNIAHPMPEQPAATREMDTPPHYAAQQPAQSIQEGPPEDEPNLTASFAEGSRAAELFADLSKRIEEGKKLADEDVVKLFSMIKTEKGATVSLSYCKRFLDATKESPDSTEAILGFVLHRAAALKPDTAFVKPYLDHDHDWIVALALEVIAASPRATMELDEINQISTRKWSGQQTRGAALDLRLAKAPDSIKEFSTLKLIRGAGALRWNAFNRGSEVRLAQHLVGRINTDSKLNAEDLTAVQMPLLHLMQDINRTYPGYLEQIEAKDASTLNLVCRELAAELITMREVLGDKVVARPGMRMISALHDEPHFGTKEMEKIAKRFDLELSVFKGTSTFSAHNPKDDYLKALRELSAASDPSIVWNHMHGGPKHLWFHSGQPGVEVSDQLADPRAVSYREFAQALAKPQIDKAKEDTKPAVIKLDHITVVNDACEQHAFIQKVHTELLNYAKNHGATVESLPTMITASQRGMYGYGVSKRGLENEDYSFLQSALERLPIEQKEPLKIKHLYAADADLNYRFLNKLKVHDAPAHEVLEQDLAIFQSRFMEPGDLLKRIEPALKQAEIEPPKKADNDDDRAPLITEIGSSGQRLPQVHA